MAGFNVSVGADSRKAERELKSFEQKTKKIAGSIAKGFKERIGHKLFDGLSGALRTVPGLLKDSIDQASSLNEEISKSQTIFQDSAEEVRKWAQNASQAMGLSEVAALEASGTIGNMFRAMGLASDEASKMSRSMVELAADLGSFNNTSTDDAIEAIGAALRGESEPIRRYGVLLNEATLKAKAFEMGIYDGKGALDPAAKSLAAYQVILDQTKTAQGDFAKTSDGLANSTKILQAQLDDASSKIGEALLPAMQELVALLRDADVSGFAKDIGTLAKEFIGLAENVSKAYQFMKDMNDEVGWQIGGGGERPNEWDPDKSQAYQEYLARKKLEDVEKANKRFEEDSKKQVANARAENIKITEEKKKQAALEHEKIKKAEQANMIESENTEKESYNERVKSLVSDIAKISFDKAIENAQNKEQEKKTLKEESFEKSQTRLNNELFNLENQMSATAGRSGNVAVSSMQRIGGGGGVYSELGLQKKQSEIQANILNVLKEMQAKPPAQLSDF